MPPLWGRLGAEIFGNIWDFDGIRPLRLRAKLSMDSRVLHSQ